MEQLNEPLSKRKTWETHVKSSLGFPGSNHEYCKINNLSLQRFYYYKKRLGLTAQSSKKNFVRVITPKLSLGESVDAEVINKTAFGKENLPNPKWLAEFLRAYVDLR